MFRASLACVLSLSVPFAFTNRAWGQSQAQPSSTPAASHEEGAEPRHETPVFYETTTVTAQPVSSASGSVTVIDEAEAKASQARSAAELLQGVPGLGLLSSGGPAGQTNAYIRGGDPNYALVLLDGIPLNDSTDLQGGAVNLEELPAGLVNRAEIVRGPASSFYGMSSLSGVIQLFTPTGRPGPMRGSLGVETGNANLLRGLARAEGSLPGQGSFSSGLSWDQEHHRIADDRFRQLDAWTGASLPLGATTDLRLTGHFADGEADDYPDASGGPVYGSGELRHTRHHELAVGAHLEFGDPGGRRNQLTVGLSSQTRDRTSPAVPPEVPASHEDVTFTRLRVAWHLPVLRTSRTEVDLGASGEGEWARNASVLELPPVLGGDVAGNYRKTRASGGAYGGVRHQHGALLLQAALRTDVASQGGVQVNPQAGLVWSTSAGRTRLRVSGGRASKLPSFFALASPRALGGNPDLRPERTWGGEAGIDHELGGGRVELGAAYFLQEYQDLVDFDFDLFLHVNRSRVRSQGVELTSRWQPLRGLTVDAEATYLDVKDLTGGPLLHEPRWNGTARLTWRPGARASLRIQAQAVSRYLDEQIPVHDRDTVAGYGLLGVAGSFRIHDALVLRGRVDNLTGRAYETFIGFPGPGRSFWVGVGWDHS
jgi:vitamin B12 transporter